MTLQLNKKNKVFIVMPDLILSEKVLINKHKLLLLI